LERNSVIQTLNAVDLNQEKVMKLEGFLKLKIREIFRTGGAKSIV